MTTATIERPKERQFTNVAAAEARAAAPVPLLIGLTGPSSSGKTYTALRLATGIQSVYGGDIYVVDTEQRRSLHYADRFKFRHVQFDAPYGALEYRAALRYCKAQGAGVVIIDSASHEHDGPGGMLEQHGAELDRLAGNDYAKRDRMTMLAWQAPKQARRKLITAITTELNMPVIFCFRAKATTKPIKDKSDGGKLKPVEMGYMAIAGEEWLFEMALNALFLPGAEGVPSWESDKPGERAVIKLPAQFKYLQDTKGALDEEAGKRLALWAKGGANVPTPTPQPDTVPRPAAKSAELTLQGWADLWFGKMRDATDDHGRATLSAEWGRPKVKADLERVRAKEPNLAAELEGAYAAAMRDDAP